MRFFDHSKSEEVLYPVKPNARSIETLLLNKFPYYSQLNKDQRTKFLERILTFIAEKEFETREGLVLTEEMVVLISATAIQLTFGLERYLFPHFSEIIIYPDQYFSRRAQAYHKGEVNLAGIVVLSWSDFQKGHSIQDGVNLGLHEWAHVLRFDRIKNHNYDSFFLQYYDKWLHVSKKEFNNLTNGKASIFRKYGGANPVEFLAVCIEVFFEKPELFKAELPELYKHTTILLNQDPAAKIFDGSYLRKDLYKPDYLPLGKATLDLGYDSNLPGCWIIIPIILLFPLLLIDTTPFSVSMAVIMILLILLGFNARIKKLLVYTNGLLIKSPFTFDSFFTESIEFDKIFSISIEEDNGTSEGVLITTYFITIDYIRNKKIHSFSIEVNNSYQALEIIQSLKGKMVALKIKSRILLNKIKENKIAEVIPAG